MMPLDRTTPSAHRVAEQYDDGEDARHYVFEPLDASLGAASQPEPGQFFMLSVPGVGEAPFTYVGAPDARGRFPALVRRVGTLTNALFALQAGAIVGVRGPFGRGWPLFSLGQDRVLVVAGGCGLAPLCSAIEALASRAAGKTALIYGSRSEASQVLSRERARIGERVPVFETFDHPQDVSHFPGMPIDRLPQAAAALGGIDAALVCGPEIMMHATAEALRARGLGDDRIYVSLERRMHCGLGLCGHCYVSGTYACKQGPTYRYDELLAWLRKSPVRPAAVTEVHHC